MLYGTISSRKRRSACLYALQPSMPHLTRFALHHCLQRHGISRLPEVDGNKPKGQKLKRDPVGCFHIYIAELQTAEGKTYLFRGNCQTQKVCLCPPCPEGWQDGCSPVLARPECCRTLSAP